MLGEIFNLILYQPLFKALLWFYHYIPDFGIAIVILTIIIRLILYPLNQKALKSQKELALLQPKIKEMQKQYSHDKIKQGEIMMKLYKEHKINPFSSFLPILIQLPILIALFKVFIDLSKNSQLINPMFLSLIDLSQRSIFLSVLAGITQFWQSRTMPSAGQQNSKFLYFMPLITVFIGLSLPAGLPLYWTTITLLAILQQYIYDKSCQRTNK
ncbi:MAG: hypothetical protein COX44_03090 [Candidatus Portnoybacteria bacterium CG23_combo_of_CG06-09_8_20_14_all_37_13]|uniref:Membrane insertase YidC/Oxa/ALB C-terminal domain-containing protein n=1 Tax=Candidatus Portnoybacteria bacterium CG23_combo_of_CG06-09_8_20_14_all_37_13 TaxID=1974819 RepID=A0A2G9YCC7_9BACT|nr:MAG: hypothetical protein COX44_03090 [Candidatus Portnoybacteria bacterium CG23_combo_of_CG06-09_8_20_14_all_37_13]